MRQHEGALAEIVQKQAREDDRQPGGDDRAPTEMAEVDIERLGAGHRQEDGADGDEGDVRLAGQVDDRIIGVDGEKHGRVVGDVAETGKADRQEPQSGDRAEDARHAAGAEALDGEQNGQDHQRDRYHIRVEGGGDYFQALDGRQHRDRRGDDGVAVKQRGAADADGEDDAGGAWIGAAGERHQRQGAALAAVVGTQDEDHVFDGDDHRQRPDDERKDAEHVGPGGRSAAGGGMQRLAKRVDRAGADVAEDDAQSTQDQDRQALLTRFGVRCRMRTRLGAPTRFGTSHQN